MLTKTPQAKIPDRMKPLRYKIIYHLADEISLKTKAHDGTRLWQKQSILVNQQEFKNRLTQIKN